MLSSVEQRWIAAGSYASGADCRPLADEQRQCGMLCIIDERQQHTSSIPLKPKTLRAFYISWVLVPSRFHAQDVDSQHFNRRRKKKKRSVPVLVQYLSLFRNKHPLQNLTLKQCSGSSPCHWILDIRLEFLQCHLLLHLHITIAIRTSDPDKKLAEFSTRPYRTIWHRISYLELACGECRRAGSEGAAEQEDGTVVDV